MNGIKHIFFDLDHTLWDYDRSAKEILLEIYDLFELSRKGLTKKKFINTFHEVNNKLWGQYNMGLIDREYIKTQRFKEVFSTSKISEVKAQEASTYFLNNCSSKPYLMEDALTALHYLSQKYELHIITNGFQDSQNRKLTSSGIIHFFSVIVTSECVNACKPDPEIFKYSLNKAGATKEQSLMIGDNPRTDIQGAKDFGIKTIFYNPSRRKRSLADFTIQSHMELLKILK